MATSTIWKFRPSPALFRHFIEQVRDLTGSVYGRRMYEVMRYWDEDRPEWVAEERDFAAAWRNQPKWVVSRSLKSVGCDGKTGRKIKALGHEVVLLPRQST